MCVLALDLGGSHVGCAVVDDGRVLAKSHIDTDANSITKLLPEIRVRLVQICETAGIDLKQCKGIGIGVPSLVDGRSGEILSAFNKFTDLNTTDLRAWSEREFGLTAKFENDASLALLGEHSAGAAKGIADVVLVTLGTGIGVSAMLQHQLLRSRLGHAGSLGGHFIVRFDGRRCACGSVGCAEAEASTSVLPAIASSWPNFNHSLLAKESALNFETLFRARDAGDMVAYEILVHCIAVWSALALTLVHAYGPQLMLFGGGVMRRGEEILGPIRDFVKHHAWKSSRGSTQISAAELGEEAAFIGAEALFREGSL
jgi:glucokinase